MQSPLNKTSDKILLLRASKGDADAYGILFDRYSARIYRFIFFKVSSKELAEDLASQTFLKAWEQISNNKKVIKFQAWLYMIARNLVIDYYRSREKEELPLIYAEDYQSTEISLDPARNLEVEELKSILYQLKSEVREIIILRYIEGLSIKEVAKITDKSSSNVRVIIHRALKDLKTFLN